MSSKRRFSIPSGPNAFRDELIERFPEEEKAILKFFSMVGRVRKQTKAFALIKILPLWLVRFLNMLRLPYFLSDFFSLGRKTVKEVVEVLSYSQCYQDIVLHCYLILSYRAWLPTLIYNCCLRTASGHMLWSPKEQVSRYKLYYTRIMKGVLFHVKRVSLIWPNHFVSLRCILSNRRRFRDSL